MTIGIVGSDPQVSLAASFIGSMPIVSNTRYIGLDTATTTGIAFWFHETNVAWVTSVKGDPMQQLDAIVQIVKPTIGSNDTPLFVFELMNHFRNAKTARSLCERMGYIKYTLMAMPENVTEHNMNSVKKYFKVKKKEELFMKFIPYFFGSHLTSDETDALALAMYQAHLDGIEPNWELLQIQRGAIS